MGAAINGLALHGGILKPFGSTFFVFTDYMRPPIRLSALMGLDVVWIFTHDSVAVGEDGPDPSAGRAPGRDAGDSRADRDPSRRCERDRRGVAADRRGARRARLASCSRGRTCRRSIARRYAPAAGLGRGAYVLARRSTRPTSCSSRRAPRSRPRSSARDLLAEKGMPCSVVSMPSWELFEAQAADYRDEVLPAGAAEDLGRGRLDVRLVALGRRLDRRSTRFGASGKGGKVLEHFGITPENVAARVRRSVAELAAMKVTGRLHAGRADRGAGRRS